METASKCICGASLTYCNGSDNCKKKIRNEYGQKSKENTLSGEDSETISMLIRYGYQHAINELTEWIENRLDKQTSLLSQKYIGETQLLSKLSDMSNSENKKTINVELLKQEAGL